MKHIAILLILLVAISCGSRSGDSNEQGSQTKEFDEFLALFPDITNRLGDEEEIVFPLNQEAFDSLIMKLPDSIPTRFKKYIHMEDSAFLFYGITMAQFGEGRPYYPMYKVQSDSFNLVIVYYTVPEVPRQRVMGEHYLLFTYTREGNFIDAYALAFSGTYNWDDGSPDSRYAKFSQFNNIKVATSRARKELGRVEFSSVVAITNMGKVEETPEQVHFNEVTGTWILAEQNGVINALKECDQWVETLNMVITDVGEMSMEHFTGQMTTVYQVESFTTKSDDNKMYFNIYDPVGDKRGAGTFYYDDPEHITIRIKGLYLYNDTREDTETLFVKKTVVDNESIEIKVLPCAQEQ